MDLSIKEFDCDYTKTQSLVEEKNKLEEQLDKQLDRWIEIENY